MNRRSPTPAIVACTPASRAAKPDRGRVMPVGGDQEGDPPDDPGEEGCYLGGEG